MEVAGPNAFVTLNNSTAAANSALKIVRVNTNLNLNVSGGGRVDPASANNFIGAGSNSGLVNGVNGNVVQ